MKYYIYQLLSWLKRKFRIARPTENSFYVVLFGMYFGYGWIGNMVSYLNITHPHSRLWCIELNTKKPWLMSTIRIRLGQVCGSYHDDDVRKRYAIDADLNHVAHWVYYTLTNKGTRLTRVIHIVHDYAPDGSTTLDITVGPYSHWFYL